MDLQAGTGIASSIYVCVCVCVCEHPGMDMGFVLGHQDSVCTWPLCCLAVPERSEPSLGQLLPHTHTHDPLLQWPGHLGALTAHTESNYVSV